MLILEKIIEQIKKEAIETGSPTEWKNKLSDRINFLLPSENFSEDLNIHILSEVEQKVTSYFTSFEKLKLTQPDYERLKQTWHDCLPCRKKYFIFSTTEQYENMWVEQARLLIKYLEVNEKVQLYEPKPTVKFSLLYKDEIGVLGNEQGLKFQVSRSLIKFYKSDVQLVANVHFFIRSCPVCSRYADTEATLSYCPECDKHEYIAYPNISFDDMMTQTYDYDDDDFPNRSNSRYGNDNWSDKDIDDIFEGDSGNSWNVD